MVATAVMIESAAHVDLPKLQAPTVKQQPRGVTVTYTAERQIYVNQKAVSESGLAAALRDALAKSAEKMVVFNGDPRVVLGDMVHILDIAKTAGAAQIALAVSKNAAGADTAGGAPVASGVPGPEAIVPGGGPAPDAIAPAGEP
jgi:biopolymer transport protein ExbD